MLATLVTSCLASINCANSHPRLNEGTFIREFLHLTVTCCRKHNMIVRDESSRRQLVPFFSTISILNISTKMLTTNPGWHFCRNAQNGDCRKKKGTSCRRLSQTKILERWTKEALFKGAKNHWNVLPSKSGVHLLFIVPKSSFGEHEGVGRQTHGYVGCHACTSHLFTPHKRRLWKSLSLPKSSFGEHDVGCPGM